MFRCRCTCLNRPLSTPPDSRVLWRRILPEAIATRKWFRRHPLHATSPHLFSSYSFADFISSILYPPWHLQFSRAPPQNWKGNPEHEIPHRLPYPKVTLTAGHLLEEEGAQNLAAAAACVAGCYLSRMKIFNNFIGQFISHSDAKMRRGESCDASS